MHEPDRDLAPPPGWGTPFPPEKPRTDAAEPALDVGPMPTAAAVAAASFTGDEVVYDFSKENRRPLDGRRILAYLIDEVLVLVVAVAIIRFLLYDGITAAAILLGYSFKLSYYFLCETLWGRTPGKAAMRLRVVRHDGRGAPAAKIAGRTIFRLIEDPVIALVSFAVTGRRRLRIGDVAAGTIVRNDDRPFVRAPESPLLVVYPLLWLAGALVAVPLLPDDALFHRGRSHDAYMVRIDDICAKRNRMAKALYRMDQGNMLSIRVLLRQETRKIEKLGPPPKSVRRDVDEVLRIHRQLNREIDRTLADVRRSPADATTVVEQHATTMQTLMEDASHRFRDMGLPSCRL